MGERAGPTGLKVAAQTEEEASPVDPANKRPGDQEGEEKEGVGRPRFRARGGRVYVPVICIRGCVDLFARRVRLPRPPTSVAAMMT